MSQHALRKRLSGENTPRLLPTSGFGPAGVAGGNARVCALSAADEALDDVTYGELAVRVREGTLASESESLASGRRLAWLRQTSSAAPRLAARPLMRRIFRPTARRAAVPRSTMGDVGRGGWSSLRRPRDDDGGSRSDEAPARPVRRTRSDSPLELAESSELTPSKSLGPDEVSW
jgi:hypothetical protein